MKIISSLFSLAFFTYTASSTCQPQWIDLGKSCIRISNTTFSWKEADNFCRNNYSARLILFEDQGEYSNFYKILNLNIKVRHFNDHQSYWTGHNVIRQFTPCNKTEEIKNKLWNKEMFFCVLYAPDNTLNSVPLYQNSSRQYICQINKENRANPPLTTIKSDIPNNKAHVSNTDTSLILVISICATITIIASVLGVVCIYRFKIKKNSQNSLPSTTQNNKTEQKRVTQDSEEDASAYVTIGDNDENMINKTTSSETCVKEDLLNPSSAQEQASKNEGRYISEDGLVYVTVSHINQSKSGTTKKTDSRPDEIEYATVSKKPCKTIIHT